METIKSIFTYFITHGAVIAGVLVAMIAAAEAVVRLTPTKKDDTAVERAGKFIRKAIDYVGQFVPNKKEGGGEHPKQVEKESPKEPEK